MRDLILDALDDDRIKLDEKKAQIYLFTKMNKHSLEYYSKKSGNSADQYVLYHGSNYMLQSTLDHRGFDIVIKTSKQQRYNLGSPEFRELIELFL